MRRAVVCFFLFLFTGLVFAGETSINRGETYLARVEFESAADLQKIIDSNFLSFSKGAGFVIGEASLNALNQLKNEGLAYSVLDTDPRSHDYYFVWYRGKEPLAKALEWIKSKARVLYQEDKMFLVQGNPEQIEQLPGYQMSLQKLFQKPRVLELPSPETKAFETPAYSPVIASMINKVKTEDIMGMVKDLSGERSVVIRGVPDSIATRYTGSDGNYKASEYLLEKLEQMGIEAVPDTFYEPYAGFLCDVKAASDGLTAWLCSSRGWILKTDNGGQRWSTVDGTSLFKLDRFFRLDDDTLWAAGQKGLVVNSTDRGASWTEKARPTGKNLHAVFFESNLSGWVAGDSGKVYYTSDGGSSWTAQASGTANALYDITFARPDEGWIVGAGGKAFHTTDRGLSWTAVSLGTANDLNEVEFVTPLKGWIVGASGTVRHTTDGGANWLTKDVGLTGSIDGISFSRDDTLKGWMVSFVEKSTVRTTDGGENWIKGSTPENYSRMDFASSQTGWAVGGMSLGKSLDAGAHWSSQFGNLAVGKPYINVVATMTGQAYPNYEFLITAHYDDYSGSPQTYAPGADDNASGTAAVLEAASIMKDYGFMYTVRFICVTAEEQGLIGSDVYAEKASRRGDIILGVLNFDMISYDGNHDGNLEIHSDSNSLGLMYLMENVNSDYGLGFTNRRVIINTGVDYSDHASFWTYNYPAVLGIEDDYDFNPRYHSTGDKIAIFDSTYFRKFCQLGLASLAAVATPYFDQRGDVNLDLQTNISDAVFLVNYLFKGGPAPALPTLADVDCSGGIEIADVVYLISYLFRGGPAPCGT